MTKRKKLDEDKLTRLYSEGLTLAQTAVELGCSQTYVFHVLERLGIQRRVQNQRHCELTSSLLELFDGLLLGDGSLEWSKTRASTCFSIGQCNARIGWLLQLHQDLTEEKLAAKVCPVRVKESLIDGRILRPGPASRLRTPYYVELRNERLRWYPDDKKVVPSDVALTPRALAQWYFGDGCLGRRQISLFTNGFSVEEVDFLAERLRAIYGWQPKVNRGPILRLNRARDRGDMLALVAPYAPTCLNYKLGID